MKDDKKVTLEYRQYDIYPDFPILPLVGESWVRHYEVEHGCYHFHNHLEIGYCHWGEGIMYIDNESLPFGPGHFTFIPKNIPHSTSSKDDTYAKWSYLFVDLEGITGLYNKRVARDIKKAMCKLDDCIFMAHEQEMPRMAKELQDLIDLFESGRQSNKIVAWNSMMDWLLNLCPHKIAANDLVSEAHDASLVPIIPALDFVSEHYKEPFTIGNMAEECLMSEVHFRRRFHELMGQTPLDYVHTFRIQKACGMLKSTGHSITQIATNTGYTSMATFSRNFHSVVGMTPLKWRNLPENQRKNMSNYNIRRLEGWF